MPIIESAKKRVRVSAKQRVQNLRTKRMLRDSVKDFYTAVESKKDSTKAQSAAYSAIDTAVKKGVITKNKAARQKSQLNAASKAAGTTKAGAKSKPKASTKKTPAKKTTAANSKAKKPTAKKTTARKAPSKKTTKK